MLRNFIQPVGSPLVLILKAVLCIALLFLGNMGVKKYREYRHFKEEENRIQAKLTETKNELTLKEAYLSRLLHDRELLERLARKRLGYARPNELIFRFSDEP